MTEAKVVQCNYCESTSSCSEGARAYLGWKVDVVGRRALILARSRSGRWVYKWENLKRLHNFRYKTLVESDPLWRFNEIARDVWSGPLDGLNELAEKLRCRT